MINRKQLIKKYLEFFKSKNHKEIPNANLIPQEDPTTLFIGSGVETIIPYLLGQKHPLGKRLVNVQKCIRTRDIEEVGDTTHHTFFEMLGNWSLGDYWKKEAIEMSFEFLTSKKGLGLPVEKLAVTCFNGDKDAPKDNKSVSVWAKLGIPKQRIAFLPKKDNFWGPAGRTGPCGPNSEMFYWSSDKPAPEKFNPEDKRWVEIWNDVFMEYTKNEKGNYTKLKQQNVDTGMGIERTVAVLNKLDDDYLTETFKPIIKKIEKLSNKKYSFTSGNLGFKTIPSCWEDDMRTMRIIADHIKASVFIISDGVVPGNAEQGYILRRLIRRAIRYGRELGMKNFTSKIAEPVFKIYDDYSELQKNKKQILQELKKEEENFNLTLEKGLSKFNKISKNKKELSGKDVFLLYQSYGFPIEMTQEISKEKGIKVNKKEFEKELKKHQELSRTASVGKFKSGLADSSEETTKLHTATHLLLAALRIVLNNKNIFQKGSNITSERLRLDFSFPRKLTKEELKKVEDLVNAQIQNSCEVVRKEMSPEQAKKKGAIGTFDEKYNGRVSVYSVGGFSKEICAGPHVKNTKELGEFKIKKESSSSAGVRRIKGILI